MYSFFRSPVDLLTDVDGFGIQASCMEPIFNAPFFRHSLIHVKRRLRSGILKAINCRKKREICYLVWD